MKVRVVFHFTADFVFESEQDEAALLLQQLFAAVLDASAFALSASEQEDLALVSEQQAFFSEAFLFFLPFLSLSLSRDKTRTS